MNERGLKLGEWLFKKRDYTPVPLIVVGVIWMIVFGVRPTQNTVLAGAAFVILGELIRFWGVSFIGPISRTRSNKTGNLQDAGPFSVVRNPLYVGNFFLSLGLVVVSNVLWLVPVYILAFAFQYHYIVAWEEWNLTQKFGKEYQDYCKRVPRWFPRPDLYKGGSHDFKKALKSERVTVAAIVAVSTALFVAAQMGYTF